MSESFACVVIKMFGLLNLLACYLRDDYLCNSQTLHQTFLLKNAFQTLNQIENSTFQTDLFLQQIFKLFHHQLPMFVLCTLAKTDLDEDLKAEIVSFSGHF